METKVPDLDIEKRLVISTEDTTNIRNFYNHFNIPMSGVLEQALANFDAVQTYDNQILLRNAICEDMVKSEHEAFKDDMIAGVVRKSLEITYRSKFDKELEDVLTTTNNEKNGNK